MSYQGTTSDSGAVSWYLQRITGAILFFQVLFHFGVYHFVEGVANISYDLAIARLANPWWKTFEFSFLIFALYHGMNGIKMIIDDYVIVPGWRIAALTVLYTGIFAIFMLGAVAIIVIHKPVEY
ncbi:MAG TPA: succinate dehydrogenase, hydrophobic membrane anchor protein [bacterium]|nr:succinate dehydrogenase, hydrophobic membrane anchor protein [bacterium]